MAFAVLFLLAFAAGTTFYAFPIYINELVHDRGFSLNAASGAVTVFFLTTAIAGVGVGSLLRWVDSRWMILVGAAIAGTALSTLGGATTTSRLIITFVVMGIGSAASTMMPTTAVIVAIFHEKRAQAIAVSTSGLSVGGILIAPLVSWWINSNGLSACAPWLGLIYFVAVATPGVLFITARPSRRRDAAAAAAAAEAGIDVEHAAPLAASQGVAYREAIVQAPFFIIAIALAVLMADQMGPQVHVVRLGEERGVQSAVFLVSMIAFSSLVGRVIGALIMARMRVIEFTALVGCVQVCGLLFFALSPGVVGLAVGASLYGFCIGNLSVVMSILVVEVFGVRDFPRIFALNQLFVNSATAFGPFLIALGHDALGSYRTVFLILAVASFGAAMLTLTLRRWRIAPAELAP